MSEQQFEEDTDRIVSGEVVIRSYLVDEFGNEATVCSYTTLPIKTLMKRAQQIRNGMDRLYAELGFVHLSMQIELEQGTPAYEAPQPKARRDHLRLVASHGTRLAALTLSAVCVSFCLDAYMAPAMAGTLPGLHLVAR